MSLAVVISTATISYLIDALLVGLALYLYSNQFGSDLSSRKIILILFLIFGFLDSYHFPALVLVDATITVRNVTVAKALDLYPNFPLVELFGFDWYEITIWFMQALVAIWLAKRIARRGQRNAS